MSVLLTEFINLRPKLVRYLTARTGSEAEADEIVQETWLKLDDRQAQTQTGNIHNPAGYIFRTAENCLRDRLRMQKRQAKRDTDWSDANFGRLGEPGNSNALDPQRILISKQELEHAERALDELPERTSAIFRAFRLDGRKQQELASELQISLSAVEKHLQRAYAAIALARQNFDGENE